MFPTPKESFYKTNRYVHKSGSPWTKLSIHVFFLIVFYYTQVVQGSSRTAAPRNSDAACDAVTRCTAHPPSQPRGCRSMGVPRVQPVRRTATGDTADRNSTAQCPRAASVTGIALYFGTPCIYVFFYFNQIILIVVMYLFVVYLSSLCQLYRIKQKR